MAVNILTRGTFQALSRLPSVFAMCNCRIIDVKRPMAVFSPYYLEPVFKKDELKALEESGEALKRANLPVKPPKPYQTSSELYDEVVGRFINYLMRKGDKKRARETLEKAFETIKKSQIERYHLATDPEEKANIELDPKVILHKAIINAQPLLQLTPIRRGGVTYQVPCPVTNARSRFMAQQWFTQIIMDRDRKKIPIHDQLAWELMDAANNRGRVIKKKLELHRLCEANRAYAHYRWS